MARRRVRWVVRRSDLPAGGAELVRLWHPLLPEFTSGRLGPQGLVLGPDVPAPTQLSAHGDPLSEAEERGFLIRFLGLVAFLGSHGLGLAPEEVATVGARPDSRERPALASPPVPEWRALPPLLAFAAVAARLRGASVSGQDAATVRASVERALGAMSLEGNAAEGLRALDGGRRAETVLFSLLEKNTAALTTLAPDLLGLAYPRFHDRAVRPGVVRPASAGGATAEAALFLARGACREENESFLEIGAGSALQEGASLLRLANALTSDPREAFLSTLARGGSGVESGDPGKVAGGESDERAGPPLSVLAVDIARWDPRSRRVWESNLFPSLCIRRIETRSAEVPPWELRDNLSTAFSPGEVSSLLWLPYPTLPAAVASWETVARGARAGPDGFLRSARRAAMAVVAEPLRSRTVGATAAATSPASPSGPRSARREVLRDPVIQAAALLPGGFEAAEVAAVAGRDAESTSEALARGRDVELLVESPPGSHRYAFASQKERLRLRSGLTKAARVDAVERFFAWGKADPDRLLAVSSCREAPEDIAALRTRFREAALASEIAVARMLLHEAPENDVDLGQPILAARVHFASGEVEEARAAVARSEAWIAAREGADPQAKEPLNPAVLRDAARLFTRLSRADLALRLVAPIGSATGALLRARVLVDAHRDAEAARLLAEEISPDALTPPERVELAILKAASAEKARDFDAAERHLRKAAQLLSLAQDAPLTWEAAFAAGYVADAMGRWEEAIAFFRRVRDGARDTGLAADAANDISVTLQHARRFEEAEREIDEALHRYAARGDHGGYIGALANRADVRMEMGRFAEAREDVGRVLAFESRKGGERAYLFSVPTLQRLSLLNGDLEGAAQAFREAGARFARFEKHPARRGALLCEAERLLACREPARARAVLVEAAAHVNRVPDEGVRQRLLASAAIDLGDELGDLAASSDLDGFERRLLRAEASLKRGEPIEAAVFRELRSRLGSPREAGAVVARLLEWTGRFLVDASHVDAGALFELGESAAAKAGLGQASDRFAALRRALERKSRAPSVSQGAEGGPSSAESPARGAIADKVSKAKGAERTHVAEDASTREVFGTIAKVARTSISILILGESGTGKEVAALPDSLAESELFGHSKGAFTGADRERAGLIEASSTGTLFLDEIGELSPMLQAKLLRVLQEREVRRVGENRERRVDLRVVAATHRNLPERIRAGAFRQDLYFRLEGAVVTLAPLRERTRDLARLIERAMPPRRQVTSDARAALMAYAWPGNIRELLSALESAGALAGAEGPIERGHLPAALRAGIEAESRDSPDGAGSLYAKAIEDARRRVIREALLRSGGNRTRAAEYLGLSRQSLLYEIKKLGLKDV